MRTCTVPDLTSNVCTFKLIGGRQDNSSFLSAHEQAIGFATDIFLESQLFEVLRV